jgi:hypothetical protein
VRVGAMPWAWATAAPEIRAIVTQTADPVFGSLDASWFPALQVVLDGRNSLRELALPASVAYHGIGIPGRAATR